MVTWLSGFIWGMGVMGIIFGLVLNRYYEVQAKKKFSWACPKKGCNFRIAANFPSTVIIEVAEHHERQHEYED
jgi:predicted small metal-binding protein